MKIKVLFPDGSVREMPAFIQQDLLDDSLVEPVPEPSVEWDFKKISNSNNGLIGIFGAYWSATPTINEKEKT